MPKSVPKNVRTNQTLKPNSISFIISSHLSQFRRIHKIFPTNLSLEKLLTPSHTKLPRKKTFSLRPPNGFILYRKDIQQEIIKNNPDVTFEIISTMASKKWKCEPEGKKNFFNLLSKVAHLVYLDICEFHVEQNKEQKEKNIMFNLYEVEDKDDEKHLDKPWMQSSIFPTMLVSPNSLHHERIAEKSKLQGIEPNGDDNKLVTLNQPFYDEIPSLISTPYDILDFDFHTSLSKTPSTPSFYSSSSFLNTNEDSMSYHDNNHFQAANYLEFPCVPDFLLDNNDNTSQLYRAGMDFGF